MDNREYRLLITLISCTMVIISRHFKKGSYMAQKWETQIVHKYKNTGSAAFQMILCFFVNAQIP